MPLASLSAGTWIGCQQVSPQKDRRRFVGGRFAPRLPSIDTSGRPLSRGAGRLLGACAAELGCPDVKEPPTSRSLYTRAIKNLVVVRTGDDPSLTLKSLCLTNLPVTLAIADADLEHSPSTSPNLLDGAVAWRGPATPAARQPASSGAAARGLPISNSATRSKQCDREFLHPQ